MFIVLLFVCMYAHWKRYKFSPTDINGVYHELYMQCEVQKPLQKLLFPKYTHKKPATVVYRRDINPWMVIPPHQTNRNTRKPASESITEKISAITTKNIPATCHTIQIMCLFHKIFWVNWKWQIGLPHSKSLLANKKKEIKLIIVRILCAI